MELCVYKNLESDWVKAVSVKQVFNKKIGVVQISKKIQQSRIFQHWTGNAKSVRDHLFPGDSSCWGAQTQTSSHAEFPEVSWNRQTDVSENSGTPKSSISIGFSITNHPFWGTPIFGNTQFFWFATLVNSKPNPRLRMRYVYVWDPGIRKFRKASCNPFLKMGSCSSPIYTQQKFHQGLSHSEKKSELYSQGKGWPCGSWATNISPTNSPWSKKHVVFSWEDIQIVIKSPTQTMHRIFRGSSPETTHRFEDIKFEFPKMGPSWWSLILPKPNWDPLSVGFVCVVRVWGFQIWTMFKTLMSFHYTDGFIGILTSWLMKQFLYNWLHPEKNSAPNRSRRSFGSLLLETPNNQSFLMVVSIGWFQIIT